MVDNLDESLRKYFPRWDVAEFVFWEAKPWWAPSVQAELNSDPTKQAATERTIREMRCRSVDTDRALLESIRTASPAGLILFAQDRFRDCLLLLGRLGRLCRTVPPVLIVISDAAFTLTPFLLESGASTVYVQPVSDTRIAGWCRRAAERQIS